MTNDRCDLLCLDAPRAEDIRKRLLSGEAAYDAAEKAKALSDPTRLRLAAALREGGGAVRVRPLVDRWGARRTSSRTISRALRSRRLVRSRKDGKLVMYSLTEAGVSLLSAVVGGVAAGVAGARA